MVLPSGFVTSIESIDFYDQQPDEAWPPMSVTMRLADDLDISRGDMIVKENNIPQISQDIDVMMCWMSNKSMMPGSKYYLKHTTADVRCMIKEIKFKVDVNTLNQIGDGKDLRMNEIARVSLRTTKPLFFDSYNQNRQTGSIILIDEGTNNTVGVGMIV
jgi:sulfate adenylyltransferase subunit 1